jgi:lanosterol synthase
MLDEDGKHTWHYLDDDEAVAKWPQTLADKYYLGLPLVYPCANDPLPLLVPN